MAKTKRERGLCDVHGCHQPALTGNLSCESCWKHIRFEQEFKRALRTSYLDTLEQARLGLVQAQEQGLTEDIRRYQWDLLWIPAALEHVGGVVDGSVNEPPRALPERR